jgi:sugar/nucleoside kinase (ribokinase family)
MDLAGEMLILARRSGTDAETSMGQGLLCVGLTTLDIVARPIDALPTAETTTLIERITLVPAGTACGTALVAARLGVKTALASATGDDAAGGLVRNVLAKQGVDLSLVAELPGVPTSTTILTIDSQGRRPNFHALGASHRAEPTDAWVDRARGARFLHYAGVGGPKLDGGAGASLAAAAKAGGATVTCDLISPGRRTMDELKRLLPHVDYFMPNAGEALSLTGASSLAEAARVFHDLGAGTCIFKDGVRGSVIVTREGETRLPAHDISVVDTTSCGDSYCAGFIAALDRGWPTIEAARLGGATAGLVAQGLGTLGKLEDFAATERFMRQAPLRAVAA